MVPVNSNLHSHARQDEERHYLRSNWRAGHRRERSLFSNIQPFCWVGVITTVNHYRVAWWLISLKQQTISLFCRLVVQLHFLDILYPQPKIKSILQAHSLPCKFLRFAHDLMYKVFQKSSSHLKGHQKENTKQVPYWRPTHVRCHCIKFSCHGDPAPMICATLLMIQHKIFAFLSGL